MSEETILEIIGWLNAKDPRSDIVQVPLSENVSIGMVWPRGIDFESQRIDGYRFFSIAHGGKCVGLVIDFKPENEDQSDLHCVTSKDHRRHGLMLAALLNVILPFLAQEGRRAQRLSHSQDNESACALVRKLEQSLPVVSNICNGIETCIVELKGPAESKTWKDKPSEAARLRLKSRLHLARNLVRAARDEALLYSTTEGIAEQLESYDVEFEEIEESIFFV